MKAGRKPTLEQYVKKHFRELWIESVLCGSDDESRLVEGYKRLTNIRNRDAHSYRMNVRDADFPMVAQTFVPAFNIVVKAMGHGDHPSLASL